MEQEKGQNRLILHSLIAMLAVLLVLASRSATASAVIDYAAIYQTAGENIYLLKPAGGILTSSALAGNTLLTATLEDYESGDVHLALTDLSTGHTTAERMLFSSSGITAGMLADGRVYTVDNATMEARIYDAGLHDAGHIAGFGEYMYGSPYMTDDGSMLWCAEYGSNSVTGFSMEDGAKTRHECGFSGGLYFNGFTGFRDGVLEYLLAEENGALYLHGIRVNDMTTALSPLPQGYNYLSDGLLYAAAGNEMLFTRLGATDTIKKMRWAQDAQYPAACHNNLLAIQDTAGGTLRLYDLENNTYMGEFIPPDKQPGFYYGNVMISGNGFSVVPVSDSETGACTLYLWDYAAGEHTENAGITVMTAQGLHAEAEARAQAIAEKYEIGVRIYGEGASFMNSVYKGEAVWSDPHTLRALDSLDGFLAKLPDGMLREMCTDPVTHINIYLCGRIRRKNDEGILSAAAFTSTQGNERFIAANLYETYDLFRNLAHELMHIMEDRIYQAGIEKSLNMAGFWLTMTPDGKGGAYAYSYKDAQGNELTDTVHTGYDAAAENPDSVWFYDPYSKSFPIEDRARIFEYLFTSGDALPGYFASVHLKEKARYLCAIIRECFASAAAAETLWWERLITPASFEEYRTRVEAYTTAPAGKTGQGGPYAC